MEGESISRLFQHEVDCDPSKLEFEPFKRDTVDVKSFDCGNKELNDFLCTEEVANYEREKIGKTTLVFCEGELVAYYTISNDLLRMEYIKKKPGFSRLSEYKIEGIPAITIGRLAVDKKWQNRGIGQIIMQRITMFALDTSRNSGVRLLLVQAKEEAFNFYDKLGFQFATETRRERSRYKARGTRTMFLDISKLDYLKTD